jgi:hypothetical protein
MRSPLACALALTGLACSSSTTSAPPVNVTGKYTVDVTDEANGCNIANWMQGQQSMGIPVTVTQQGASVTATVTGLVGAFMVAGIGTNTFSGTLTGGNTTMTATGTVQGTQGSCTFTTNATVQAAFSGDTMQGTVTYTRIPTMATSACASLQGCQSVQSFAGARPPS